MKNILKNWKLYLIIILIVILGIVLVTHFVNKEDSKLNYISVSELQEKIDNKESFMLVVSQTGCPHCEQYLPELESALNEYDFKAFIINLTNLNSDDAKTFSNMVKVTGTPTSIFYKNGEETTSLNRINGSVSKSNLIERLKSLGYIE